MGPSTFRRCAFALSATIAALLAGCGGSQPPIPEPSIARENTPLRWSAKKYRTLYRFFERGGYGSAPETSLYDDNNVFYGTTAWGNGAVFSITKRGYIKLIHGFGLPPDGMNPSSGLIEENGVFYGETSSGGACDTYTGADGYGTVFSVTADGTEKILHSFGCGSDGQGPNGGLIDVNGTLYGTTGSGGAEGDGIIFSLTTSGTETVLHNFDTLYPDGSTPMAGLCYVNGTLYGTTYYGGANGAGAIFSFNPTGAGRERLVHSFSGPDGAYPIAALISVNGVLYGTTASGGTEGKGTVFSVTTTGTENVLYNFAGSPNDGEVPWAGLIYRNGAFYGTTPDGGAYGYGTIFRLTTNGIEKVLYNVGKHLTDGAAPVGGVIYARDKLYGTTQDGGEGGGTVFVLRV